METETLMMASLGTGFGEKTAEVPQGATVFALEFNDPEVVVVFRGNKEAPPEARTFLVVGPGVPFQNAGKYIGRIQRTKEVPIPRGMIIPAGVKADEVKAVEKLNIFVFEKHLPRRMRRM